MANPEHVAWLNEGVEAWNQRVQSFGPYFKADLSHAHLSNMDLQRVNFNKAFLRGTVLLHSNLSEAKLNHAVLAQARLDDAILKDAELRHADFGEAHLDRANLSNADLREVDFARCSLEDTRLNNANLTGCDLQYATLVRTDLRGANLTGCYVYGTSAWDIKFDDMTNQQSLIVTPFDAPDVSVDSLEVAQLVYLLMSNSKLRNIIDTVGRKAVLILGRFTEERKTVLEAIRDGLRLRGYVPIVFDFDPPNSRNLMETVTTLAHLSRFIIADLSEPRSVPHELARVVPLIRSIPIQPLILEGQQTYGMFEEFVGLPWMLPIHTYSDLTSLIAKFDRCVIQPAEAFTSSKAKRA